MKNTDIALVILVAVVSAVISYFLGNAILGDPYEKVETVSYMDAVSSVVQEPDQESFNSDALNPTVEVYVGNCGPMEEWDAVARVCRSKYVTSGDSTETDDDADSTDKTKTADTDDSEDDVVDSSSGE